MGYTHLSIIERSPRDWQRAVVSSLHHCQGTETRKQGRFVLSGGGTYQPVASLQEK